MKINKRNGFSILSIIMFIFIMGVLGIYGFKMGVGFLDHQTIKKSVKEVLLEVQKENSMTSKMIKDKIQRKMYTSNIELKNNDIEITRSGDNVKIYVAYQKDIQITERISIFMNLDVEETSNSQ